MDIDEFKELLQTQTIELSMLHTKFLELQDERSKTRFWQITLKADLRRRMLRLVARVNQIDKERTHAYLEAMAVVQLQRDFNEIIEHNEWNL